MNIIRLRTLCALVAAVAAAPAFAQSVEPVLEVDFVGATLPLSPWLTAACAVLLAALALRCLRRAPGGKLMGALVATAAIASVMAAFNVASIRSADAVLPSYPMPLTTSPTTLVGFIEGDIIVTNVQSASLTITVISYNPGSWDSYVDAPNTTCAVGTVLAPGASCIVRILTLG